MRASDLGVNPSLLMLALIKGNQDCGGYPAAANMFWHSVGEAALPCLAGRLPAPMLRMLDARPASKH